MRGGTVGVKINVVGCTLRRCRIQDAGSYGVSANATFTIEGCTIGGCAKAGRTGGGILARGSLRELRNGGGFNENRVQRDQNDKGYAGYIDCRGCVGRCMCNMRAYLFAPEPCWGEKGQGLWQKMG